MRSKKRKVYNRLHFGIAFMQFSTIVLGCLNIAVVFVPNTGFATCLIFQILMCGMYVLAFCKGCGYMKQNVPIVEFFVIRLGMALWYGFISVIEFNWFLFGFLCLLDLMLLIFMVMDKVKYEYIREIQ